MRYTQNIVLDFEFNAVHQGQENIPLRNEIIQIGAVRLDGCGNSLDTYTTFVKPTIETRIAWNISRLTGITTADVEEAPKFDKAVNQFFGWIGNTPTRVVTWGGEDKKVFLQECKTWDIETPANIRHWLDLQRVYPRLTKTASGRHGRMSLRAAAEWGCSDFNEACAHQALYDATKTAELMSDLLNGSYLDQRAIMNETVQNPEKATTLTSTISTMCPQLLELKALLESA